MTKPTTLDNTLDDAEAQIRQLRAQLDALMAERIRPAIEAATEGATEGLHRAGAVAEKEIEALSNQVRNRPITSVLVAAAIGYVVARLLR
jgi:ElaB/YqjD/DUF883 family membrane-anchored ribosome-binding protein